MARVILSRMFCSPARPLAARCLPNSYPTVLTRLLSLSLALLPSHLCAPLCQHAVLRRPRAPFIDFAALFVGMSRVVTGKTICEFSLCHLPPLSLPRRAAQIPRWRTCPSSGQIRVWLPTSAASSQTEPGLCSWLCSRRRSPPLTLDWRHLLGARRRRHDNQHQPDHLANATRTHCKLLRRVAGVLLTRR